MHETASSASNLLRTHFLVALLFFCRESYFIQGVKALLKLKYLGPWLLLNLASIYYHSLVAEGILLICLLIVSIIHFQLSNTFLPQTETEVYSYL